MNRIKFLSLIFGFLSVLALSACQSTGGGYSSRTWDYSRANNAHAERAPKTITKAPVEINGVAQGEEQTSQAPVPGETLKGANLPPVKVALLLPLSGKSASLGQAMLQSSQLALFDVAHANFELLTRDTGGTANGARNAARAVLAEGADLILGPVFASSVNAVKSVARSANVNVIGFSTDWGLAGGNTFIMGFLPFDQVERLAQYTAAQNIGRVGILAPRGDYGNVVTTSWQSAYVRLGVPPAGVTRFSRNDRNLAPLLRKFTQYDERVAAAQEAGMTPLQMEPPFDAVLLPMGGQTAVSVSNLLNHYDLPPKSVKRLGTGLFDDEGLATESSLNGAWFAAPSPKLRRTFEKRYLSTYGVNPPRLATLAYDATALAAVLAQRGLQSNGRPDFSARAIANPNGFAGIDGIFRFRPNGTAERGLAILQYSRGNIRVIDDAPTTFQDMGY